MKKILILIALVFCLTGCKKVEYPVSDTDFLLNTVSTIDVYAYEGDEDPAVIIDECFDYIRELEKILSRTVKNSDIAMLNKVSGGTVKVSDETREVLEKSILYGNLTDGAFDVTIARVSEMWDFVSGEEIVPEENAVKEAVETVDYNNIKIDGNNVYLENGSEIDLGAIAKGYIADKASEFLRDKGVTSAIVNLGGNNIVIGRNGERAFRIGIQKPTATTGEFSGVVNLEDMSIVTSGAYQRFFVKDGVTYHHILDPETGYPAESDIASVSIICETSADADALSTSCFILGVEKAVELMDSLDYACAVIITTGGEIILTEGADMYFENIE
ncbi:MAG: FAD:protein FMN transferase [Firmicutes bacterium]|nr:FAD:protein FMN transferase [Bacillota bacterium]